MTFHIFNNYVLDTLYVSTTSTIVNLLVKTVYQTQFARMAKQLSNDRLLFNYMQCYLLFITVINVNIV